MIKIISFDETGYWTDDDLITMAEVIWGAYVYDDTERTYCREGSPSYLLHFVCNIAKNELNDEMDGILNSQIEDKYHYVHCSTIEKFGGGQDTKCETIEEAIAYYQAIPNDIPVKCRER